MATGLKNVQGVLDEDDAFEVSQAGFGCFVRPFSALTVFWRAGV